MFINILRLPILYLAHLPLTGLLATSDHELVAFIFFELVPFIGVEVER